MDPNVADKDLDVRLKERFAQLPKVVQEAITSADVEKHLRELADSHKLHIDQWQLLENEVMLTLLGFQKPEDLQSNIKSAVGTTEEIAHSLADDISHTVFQPIREELERQLEHPAAKAAQVSDMEASRSQLLASESEKPAASAAPVVAPSTPPAPPPTQKVERAPISEVYTSSTPSHERKIIQGDPYREQLG